MLHASGLVPARFLTLLSHLVLCVTLLLSRESNVLSCLPYEHTERDRERKDVELAAGLGVAIGEAGNVQWCRYAKDVYKIANSSTRNFEVKLACHIKS